MKPQWNAVSEVYQAALQKYLSAGGRAQGRKAARQVGRRAVESGMETLDLARIHKQAMVKVMQHDGAPGSHTDTKAREFFMEAIGPIEGGHRASVASAAHLKGQTARLAERNAELAVANRHLKVGITQRDTAVATLRKSERQFVNLLRDSRRLAARQQKLTHRLLKMQEQGRRSVSGELRDGVGQTLVGLNIRLAALRKGAVLRNTLLAEEILSTQAVLDKTVQSLKRFLRDATQEQK